MGLIFFSDRRLYSDARHFEKQFAWPFGELKHAPLLYHCYWTGPLTPHHDLSLKSLLITQSAPFEVWIWMPPQDLIRNHEFIERFKALRHVKWKPYCAAEEVGGTIYEGCPPLLSGVSELKPGGADRDALTVARNVSDALRLLVLGKYGGFYFDLDTLFLKDLRPLSSVNFIYQWSNRPYGSNAVSHFHKESSAIWTLAERSLRIASCHPRRLLLFAELDVLQEAVFLLPSFALDPVWIANDTGARINDYCNRFDDFFNGRARKSLGDFFPNAYTYDWHNRWTVQIEDGTIAGQLYKEVRLRFDRLFE